MIHREAAVGFGRAADAYERGRPGYPGDAVGWMARELRLGPGSVVVDLAAGTGKLTRLLALTGARVVAIEPVAAMRSKLAGTVAGIEVIGGTAEAMPLPDGAADAVTVAQALHWFDLGRALPQIHRVLRPGGRLAVLYNRRDLSQPLFQEVDRIIDPHRGDVPKDRYDPWLAELGASPLFAEVAEREFPNEQRLDVAAFLDRITSTSYVAALPDATRAHVEDELRKLAAGSTAPISLRYRSVVNLYDRA